MPTVVRHAQLKAGQQLCLLGGEFLFAEDSFVTQFSKLLDGREDVHLTDRPRTCGLWRRGRRRDGSMPWHAVDRQNGQAGYIHQTVLAGKRERPSRGLLLREAADLVIKRVVNGYPAVDFDCQTPGLPEIGVTNVVLGAGA